MRRATTSTFADERAHELVLQHIGARSVPSDLLQQVEWAVAERLHDELLPALDASLARLLDVAAIQASTPEPTP